MPTAVEQIMWTAVPNGIGTGATGGQVLNLSVFVSPTLSVTGGTLTGTLSDFPDFQNWPQLVSSSRDGHIHVAFTDGSGTALGATTIAIDPSVVNNALWLALFSPAGSIQYMAREPYEFKLTTTPVVSYPADQVANFLKSTYTNLAINSPTSYPSVDSLGSIYGQLGYANQDGIEELGILWNFLSSQRLNPPASGAGGKAPYYNDWSTTSIEDAFAALRFYHMAPGMGPGKSQPPPPVALPTVDFHRALTFIGDHRTLQRALGLVFDVSVSTAVLPSLTSSVNSDIYVRAYASNVDGTQSFGGSGVTYTGLTPRTQCNASTSVFEAHPATGQIVGRQLTLGDPSSFSIYEIDVDGGGLKTTQFADNLKLAQQPRSNEPSSSNGPAPDAPQSYAPPSLRSSGLTVAAVNRGKSFVTQLNNANAIFQASPLPDLTAEDLVKGFVLDVYDAAGKTWHSTSMRDVEYVVSSASITLGPVTDEPGTDAPPRMQNDPTNSSQTQLNLPENLIRWNGWSNAAPRYGTPLADDGSTNLSSGPGSGPFNQLAITGPSGSGPVTPHPGSLPRLRYGSEYALRARVVDIAGNVIALNDPNAAGVGDALDRVSPLSAFGRHEPIGSPDIYTSNTNPLPGESLKRLVIRDIDASPSSDRTFAPNRIAESFAELHSEFDTGSGGALDPTAYSLIVGAESQRYPGSLTPSGVQVWNPITLTAPVPFLPDPLARGGTLFVTLGPLTGQHYQFDFNPASGQKWPAYQPYGIVFKPGAVQNVALDATTRQLTFETTKGDTVTMQLSSYMNGGDLLKFGLAWWIAAFYAPGTPPAALGDSIVEGLTWAFTPWTTLELVYAVQKPLLIPKFANMFADKVLGQTFATIGGDITYSPKSTARTDLLAAWGDPVDNGPGTGTPQGPGVPKPHQKLAPRQATVFTIPSSHDQKNSEQDRFSGPHELFDTKHRFIAYTGKATSSFTEHYQGTSTFTVPSPGTATALNLPGHSGLGLEDGSVTVTGSDGTPYAENTGFTLDLTAGKITFAAAPAGPPTGSTVTVRFLPPVTVESVPTTLNILSSARPLSADVEFVVPIFKWSKIVHHGKETLSGRTSAGLRVFLSRPWWSSGIGELLGVTTDPAAEKDKAKEIPSPNNLYVSDWGLDPVFRGPKIDLTPVIPPTYGKLPSPHPRLDSFVAKVHTGKNLTIEEIAGIKVNVAGHKVEYDERRDLWYSDILIDIGEAYTPMIRLGLARYQPDSVPNAQLSRIVLADIMSLDPARIVSIVRGGPGLLKNVTLAGFSYSIDGDQTGTGPGYATLVVERRVTEIHDEVLGWEPVGKPIEMTAVTGKEGVTYWTARNVKFPAGGKHRLFIAQYEVIPTDRRRASINIAYFPSDGLRLLYQDLIPL